MYYLEYMEKKIYIYINDTSKTNSKYTVVGILYDMDY